MTAATTTVLRDQQGGRVQLGTQLGVGGQGAVHRVDGQADVVAKVYLHLPGKEETDKLAALIRAATPALTQVSAWPRGLLLDDAGALKGFLMPLVNAEYQEVHQLYRRASRRQHFPDADWRFLIHVARNVTRAFGTLHQHGHLMGDVSSRNVMVSKNGTVRFIDTDSFQVREGARVYTCPVGTAEFTPPELQGQRFGTLVRGEQHDLFGLALLLFHLLFEGRHPYSGVYAGGNIPSPAEAIAKDSFAFSTNAKGVRSPPGALPLTSLHPGMQVLFERAFSPVHTSRPTAQEWDGAFAELTAQLTTCKTQPSHVHDRRVACPWCDLDRQSGMKSSYPSGVKRVDVEGELNRIWRSVAVIPAPTGPVLPGVQHQPDPLPLPVLPPYTAIHGRSRNVTVFGTILLLIALYGLFAGSVGTFLFFTVMTLLVFSGNSKASVARRRREHAVRFSADQRVMLTRETEKHIKYKKGVQEELQSATIRLQSASAARRFQQALDALSMQRKEIRELALREQNQLAAVIQQESQPMLERFLGQQHLQPGIIPGIGPSLVQNLKTQGISTARDIDGNILHLRGVGPKRALDLLRWRSGLEAYFTFDPATVPPAKLQAVHIQIDQQRTAKLQQLERQAQELTAKLASWRKEEAEAIAVITFYQTEIMRVDLTLKELQPLLQRLGN